jgi:hypothetical protein
MDRYRPKWQKWREYIGQKGREESVGMFMDELNTKEKKVYRMIHFMSWLYQRKGLRGEQVRSVLSSVSSIFEINGRDCDWRQDGRILRARKACNITVQEENEKFDGGVKRQVNKLPVTADMVRKARAIFWGSEKGWNRNELDEKVLWLAIGLGFDSGLRPGMIVLKEGRKVNMDKGDEDEEEEGHCVKFGRVVFTLCDGSKMKGGREFNEFIMRNKDNVGKVMKMDTVYVTHKMSKQFKDKAIKVKSVERRSLEESQMLEDACLWFAHAGTQASDEIFTRYCEKGRRRVLRRQDIGKGLKKLARKCGLNDKYFSSKSLRLGYASHCKAIGVSKEERNERGTWAKNSTVPDEVYQYEIGNKGALAYGLKGKGLSKDSLERMIASAEI